MCIQGVYFFYVHIFTTYGGMRTPLYSNFVLCKFIFCKKLQRFEFVFEKTILAVKSLSKFKKIKCASKCKRWKLEWNSTYFCRFDFQIKHMFRKIKSRYFIFCSQSLKNNYFCSFTLLSKILNEQWSIGSQPPRSNDTRFIWTYKENILVGIYMRYCKYIFTLFRNANG